MNILDRVVSYLAPQWGMRRARARYVARAESGASYDRRASNWRARPNSANVEISQALGPLRDRGRDLVRNTPHAARAVDIIVANAVGEGITPVSGTGSDGLDRRVMELWEEWQAEADIEGRLNFYAMQELACRSIVESGEVVWRFVDG